MRNQAALHNSLTQECDTGEGLQANIGQETKDSHWIPAEQQGTAQALGKQLVPWETGQPARPAAIPAQQLPGICSLTRGQPWGTSKRTVSLRILGYRDTQSSSWTVAATPRIQPSDFSAPLINTNKHFNKH